MDRENQLTPDKGTRIESEYGNCEGGFEVCLIGGQPHACVEDWDGHDWQPCSQILYDTIKAEPNSHMPPA